jgi:hypothetical protein
MGAYMVLYKRDFEMETRKNYEQKMLFDGYKTLPKLETAIEFAVQHLPALVAKQLPLAETEKNQIKDQDKPYLVVAKHYGKYNHFDYGGDSDPLTTYDVVRCAESDLEKSVENFGKEEHVQQVTVGIELKLF